MLQDPTVGGRVWWRLGEQADLGGLSPIKDQARKALWGPVSPESRAESGSQWPGLPVAILKRVRGAKGLSWYPHCRDSGTLAIRFQD